MSERYRQTILPTDDFAPEAVKQWNIENPDSDDVLRETLEESARILSRGMYHPEQRRNVRDFMGCMTGFGKDATKDNIRRMNRPTRDGK